MVLNNNRTLYLHCLHKFSLIEIFLPCWFGVYQKIIHELFLFEMSLQILQNDNFSSHSHTNTHSKIAKKAHTEPLIMWIVLNKHLSMGLHTCHSFSNKIVEHNHETSLTNNNNNNEHTHIFLEELVELKLDGSAMCVCVYE